MKDRRKTRLLFDLRILNNDWSGIASYTKNLLCSLTLERLDYDMLALLPKGMTLKKVSEITGKDMEELFSEEFCFPYSTYNIKGFLPLARIIRKKKVNIFFTPQYFWPYYLLGNIKVIPVIHDIIPLTHSKLLNKSKKVKLKFIFQLCTWLALKSADKIFVNSCTTKNEIISYFGSKYADKLEVLYPAFYSPEVEQLKKKNYLLYVGRQDPYKNIARLVEAFKLMKERGFKGELIIAGKVDKRYSDIPDKISELSLSGVVKFTGFVDEYTLKKLYSEAALCVLPSMAEGFGLTAFEPVINNCLIAVSDIPVLRETLKKTEVFFDPLNVDHMANVMMRIITLNDAGKNKLLSEIKENLSYFDCREQYKQFNKTLKMLLETD